MAIQQYTDDEVKGKILHKLARHRKWNESHTAIEHLQAGFPKDMIGRVKELINELKKEAILLPKKTNYGEQVSIDLEKSNQAHRYIELFLKKED